MTRTLFARHMAGWETENNNSSTTGSELWRNAEPSAFHLQVTMLKSDKISCVYLLVNCHATSFLNAPRTPSLLTVFISTILISETHWHWSPLLQSAASRTCPLTQLRCWQSVDIEQSSVWLPRKTVCGARC